MNSPMRSGPCSPRSCPLMSPRARSGLITKIHLIAARQAPTGDGHRPWSTRRCARVRTLDGCFAFVAYGGPAAFSTRSGDGRYACSSRADREHLRGRGIEATFAQPRDQHERRRRRGSEGGRPRPSTERPIRFVTRWSGRSTRSSRTGRSRPVMTIGPRSSMTVQVASSRIWLRDPTRSKNSAYPWVASPVREPVSPSCRAPATAQAPPDRISHLQQICRRCVRCMARGASTSESVARDTRS